MEQKLLQTLTDEELVNLYKNEANQRAFNELYKRHVRRVFLICLKYLKDRYAEDACQEIFIALLDSLKKYEIKVGFLPWLGAVTRNHCLNLIKKEKRNPELLKDFDEPAMQFLTNCYLDIKDDEEMLEKNLSHCLELLTEQQRKCFELFVIYEKRYKEIMNMLGLTYGAVHGSIERARYSLIKCLKSKRP